MKQVKFVSISSEPSGYGFKGIRNTFPDIEETIAQYIENGWDYVGFVPTETRSNGEIETLSLIFQKE